MTTDIGPPVSTPVKKPSVIVIWPDGSSVEIERRREIQIKIESQLIRVNYKTDPQGTSLVPLVTYAGWKEIRFQPTYEDHFTTKEC